MDAAAKKEADDAAAAKLAAEAERQLAEQKAALAAAAAAELEARKAALQQEAVTAKKQAEKDAAAKQKADTEQQTEAQPSAPLSPSPPAAVLAASNANVDIDGFYKESGIYHFKPQYIKINADGTGFRTADRYIVKIWNHHVGNPYHDQGRWNDGMYRLNHLSYHVDHQAWRVGRWVDDHEDDHHQGVDDRYVDDRYHQGVVSYHVGNGTWRWVDDRFVGIDFYHKDDDSDVPPESGWKDNKTGNPSPLNIKFLR